MNTVRLYNHVTSEFQLSLTDTLKDGDVLVSNHPQLAGGSHLPDITVITPVFGEKGECQCLWHVCLLRKFPHIEAHYAD